MTYMKKNITIRKKINIFHSLPVFRLRLLILFMIYFLFGILRAQTFSDFLHRVQSVPDSLKWSVVDSFMGAVPAFPFIEQDTLVHFLFRGNATQVAVPGDASYWDPAAAPMGLINGTNLWYRSAVFEPDARLDYKFVLNGNYWILDPLNPYQVAGGYGPNSELRMPLYIPPPEIEYYSGIPHGTLEDSIIHSSNLNNSRQVKVYLPPGYAAASDSLPLILFHDGLEYLSLAYTGNILDYLIWQKRIRPVIAVFVPPVNRQEEYAGSLKPQFGRFIVNEILPWIEEDYRVSRIPRERGTLGASNGGNIALWLGWQYPEIFGNIAAQSGYAENEILNGLNNGPKLDLTFYLDLGKYDIPIIVSRVGSLVTIMNSRGYDYQYRFYYEGHSWGNWRAHIDNALEMFFPPATALKEKRSVVPENPILKPNFPNPFNSSTVISFQLMEKQQVRLDVYNIYGEHIQTLKAENLFPGTYSVIWDGRNDSGNQVSSGIYFIRLKTGNFSATRKIILMR